MLWQLQLFFAWLMTAQTLNLCFAGLCICMAFGMCPRWAAIISAGLYIALALV